MKNDDIKSLPLDYENGTGSLLSRASVMGAVLVCIFNPMNNEIMQPLTNISSLPDSRIVAFNGTTIKEIKKKNISIYKNIDIPNLPLLEENVETLRQISNFEYNWNFNGAEPFDKKLIRKVDKLIHNLSFQPQIFPTAEDSIQLEYDKLNGDHLEFEVFEDRAEVFIYTHNGVQRNDIIEIGLIKGIVADFYG